MSELPQSRAILPEGWPQPRGYANGMVAEGRVLVTGGLVGWDAEGVFAKGFIGQLRQTFLNIRAVVEAGGGRVEDIVRLTWYVTDIAAYRASLKEMGPVYREVFGRHFPAMAVVAVTALVEPEALLEIEATAVVAG
ncbi:MULTISPECIES: RidA family protein [Bosea]|uniref:RidA family protein n=1 Tax=Bosea TaxID=85413 RepID=UPI00214FC074|nr:MULTISPECIES: RidA family protein [Bosea]MCR4520531.1 RidA family protein [Bosea sp. 47.2.35]MDR6827885.1 enamine deaminase RidA (YjgF/YER057c/UK114 family) [Bosea robiniae]MDR6894421.1 enamine deaminase RidA (YjgF/YER057c/UK114 family) [Bosea sp. BE109]MDR7137991.1 enamine deaminase RidA (YjgF/YER057c/UK114 family) [Bosea sp. BE168]MDR7174690.1 enamine deaminase RidA (YjgF/YER057c/UK114 family) [Bosea sp. BE271]